MEITLQEKEMLLSLLSTALGDTRMEVHHSKTFEYHQQLKADEELVRRLIEKVQNQMAAN